MIVQKWRVQVLPVAWAMLSCNTSMQNVSQVKDADLIITGEGAADRQTLMGKLPMGILQQSGGVPVCLIAGRVSDRVQLLEAGFAQVDEVSPRGITLEEAMRKEVALRNVSETVSKMCREITK